MVEHRPYVLPHPALHLIYGRVIRGGRGQPLQFLHVSHHDRSVSIGFRNLSHLRLLLSTLHFELLSHAWVIRRRHDTRGRIQERFRPSLLLRTTLLWERFSAWPSRNIVARSQRWRSGARKFAAILLHQHVDLRRYRIHFLLSLRRRRLVLEALILLIQNLSPLTVPLHLYFRRNLHTTRNCPHILRCPR